MSQQFLFQGEIMTESIDNLPFTRPVRVSSLAPSSEFSFDETPSPTELEAISEYLGIVSVKKMRFSGVIEPFGKEGWHLKSKLGASVTQECILTLEPVKTRIDLSFKRKYLPMSESFTSGSEVEIPEDIDVEPLTEVLDLGFVAVEQLMLELPEYPKAENALFEEHNIAPSGVKPLTDEDIKPFAGLAALKEKLQKEE